MAEYLIQSESLTSIADKIRVLSDTTTSMSLDNMETNLQEANTEANTQTNLISQITSALAEKVAPPILQSKTVTPTSEIQDIRPDSGYDGLHQVIVNGVVDNSVKVQTKSGTFTTNTSGNSKVSCGFQPDVVYITKGEGYYDEEYDVYNAFSAAACFSVSGEDSINLALWVYNNDFICYDLYPYLTNDGFAINVFKYYYDGSSEYARRTSFSYTAIKYT